MNFIYLQNFLFIISFLNKSISINVYIDDALLEIGKIINLSTLQLRYLRHITDTGTVNMIIIDRTEYYVLDSGSVYEKDTLLFVNNNLYVIIIYFSLYYMHIC